MFICLVVLLEEILAKVILKISPNGMNVIGFILGVVVFQNKGGSLHSVVVGFSAF